MSKSAVPNASSIVHENHDPHYITKERENQMREPVLLFLGLIMPVARLYAAAPPNIVLIISDDHGWGDYSFMGHPQVQTPCLDKLAAQSLTFRRGYVPASLCCPSLAAIVTGLYPHQNKIFCNNPPGKPGSKEWLDGREVMTSHMKALPTLPRLLGERGYVSFQTGKWWQGAYGSGGFSHGMSRGESHGDAGLDIGRKTMQPIYDFIADARKNNRPWFVWYAPMMPHRPYDPPQKLLDKYKGKTDSIHLAGYWAMIEWFDETCGQLLDHLDQQRLADNTIVMYVADNGLIQRPDGTFPRSKGTPYDGGVRTPIMIRWLGKVQPRMAEELAMSIDLAPTLLQALGLKPTPAMQGINLLDPEALKRRTAIYGECYRFNGSDMNEPLKHLLHWWVINGYSKLIVPTGKNRPALYDLKNDPEEKHDLAGEPGHQETLKCLRGMLDKRKEEVSLVDSSNHRIDHTREDRP